MTQRGRSTVEIVQVLSEQVRRLEQSRRPAGAWVTSGWGALDRILPARAFARGTVVEWLAGGRGSGAVTLALTAAREACREGGALVVIDRERSFYPPAAAGLGIDLANLIVVRPREPDHAWALDQVLRSPAVAAVLCWPGRWDDHTFRRLQLAAETSGSLGLLLREISVRSEPSWADLRLLVEPLPKNLLPKNSLPNTLLPNKSLPGVGRRLRVELLRSRGGMSGGTVELEIHPAGEPLDEPRQAASQRPPVRRMASHDSLLSLNEIATRKSPTGPGHEKSPLHLASDLAAPASARHSAGA